MARPFVHEIRYLAVLAAPLVLAQMAQMSMGFVDTLMVGRLGQAELAGIALGSTVFFFVLTVFMGVVLAVGPMVAQAQGADDRAAVGRAVRQGLWLSLGLSVLAVALFWQASPLLAALGQERDTVARAAAYLKAMAWGFPAAIGFTVLRSFLEGIARPKAIMVIAFFGVGLNILANHALMFGRWGFPELGLVGTGYASAIVYWTMFALGVFYIQLRLSSWRLFATLRRPDPATMREIVAIGLPIGLTLGFETGLFSATALLMGLLGQVPLAAHQIAIQTAAFTFMIPLGMSIAISVRVGQAAGRRDLAAVRRSAAVGIALSLAVMVATALAFWLAPRPIVGLYLDLNDPANLEVAALAVTFLGFAAMFQLFDGLQVSALGALRGLKDTRWPMVITLFAYWFVGLGSGVVLAFGLELGGRGLWLGLVLGLAAAGVLLLARLRWRTTSRGHLLARPVASD
jgi:MATE family multidrug resistance protein